MRPTCLVKEELRPILFRMGQFESKIQKSGFQLFGFRNSEVFAPQANTGLLTSKFSAIFGRASGHIFQKMRVLSASRPLFTLVKKLNFQAVIKSAASAASLDLQGSPRVPPSKCRAVVQALPWILVPLIWSGGRLR